MRRPARSTLLVAGLVCAAVLSTRWIRLNLSPSVPLGVYHLTPVSLPLARGALVVLPVPASVQDLWSRWVPLLKPVAAVAGDEVCVVDGGLRIEGVWYGPVLQALDGRPLPHIEGCLRIQDGTVFLASTARNSLDSRYYGAVPIPILTAQAVPLVTWSMRPHALAQCQRRPEAVSIPAI